MASTFILGSQSPRRRELLEKLGFSFEVRESYAEEIPDNALLPLEAVKDLARQKAENFSRDYREKGLLTADTIVSKDQEVLGKPSNFEEAKSMLDSLSADKHEVYSGCCFMQGGATELFAERTVVQMRELRDWEKDFYIENYKPYDKAGAYGIQEWLGMVGIERIEGSYFNVMGLPVSKVYEVLLKYLGEEALQAKK